MEEREAQEIALELLLAVGFFKDGSHDEVKVWFSKKVLANGAKKAGIGVKKMLDFLDYLRTNHT
jgi:hypothetical protein